MSKCEHKTGVTVYDESPYQITLCEWGCGRYLVNRTDSTGARLTHIIGEYATEREALEAVGEGVE